MANRIVGDATCPLCDAPIKVGITEKNKLYYICRKNEGGCGHQTFCRDPDAEKHLARRITKWTDSNERRAYLGDEALPVKARRAAPPALEPEPNEELEEPIEELEQPEEPPAPAPRPPRPIPPRRPVPPQFQKKKSSGLGFFGEDE